MYVGRGRAKFCGDRGFDNLEKMTFQEKEFQITNAKFVRKVNICLERETQIHIVKSLTSATHVTPSRQSYIFLSSSRSPHTPPSHNTHFVVCILFEYLFINQ